jgi:hypothetical protein
MRQLAATILFLATALFGAQTAQAQRSVLDDPRLAPVRQELTQSLEAARADGLPDEWLLDRMAEGLAKRVPPPAIARAVDALLTRMRTAERLVELVPSARGQRIHILRAAVDALAAGAPEAALGRLVREVVRLEPSHAPAHVREALVTVAELSERDFGGPAAADATTRAYQRARRDGLAGLLENARRIGATPQGGRDEALRRLSRDARGIDPPRGGGDHDRERGLR